MKFNGILFMIFIINVVLGKKNYEGYKVYDVLSVSEDHIESLKKISAALHVDVWSEVFKAGIDVRMMVSRDDEPKFLGALSELRLDAKLKIKDVQKLIDYQLKPANVRITPRTSLGSMDWISYHSLDEIYAWLDELVELYPDFVNTVVIGKSFEGRDIKGVLIDLKPGERNASSLHYMIEGGVHAREWISPATVSFIIKELLTNTDPEFKKLAELFVWHIFPSVNPDGYVYTFTDNRMWRKTRSTVNAIEYCSATVEADMSNGIDLNRNFDQVWMEIGASQNPCDSTYAGPSAFSEPESRAMANYVYYIKDIGNLMYYISFHSYSEMLLVPPSHAVDDQKVENVENYGDLYEIGVRAMDKISERYGTQYSTGTAADILYPTSGNTFDWAQVQAGVPISYLYELRDKGAYGFLLPPDQIVPNCEEVVDSMLEMHKAAMNLNYYSAASSIQTFSILLVTLISCIFTIIV